MHFLALSDHSRHFHHYLLLFPSLFFSFFSLSLVLVLSLSLSLLIHGHIAGTLAGKPAGLPRSAAVTDRHSKRASISHRERRRAHGVPRALPPRPRSRPAGLHIPERDLCWKPAGDRLPVADLAGEWICAGGSGISGRDRLLPAGELRDLRRDEQVGSGGWRRDI